MKDRLVAINRVTKVTKGGRTFSFSAIVVVGNEAGITSVVFDRNGYLYHGRVKELADAARNGGLKF